MYISASHISFFEKCAIMRKLQKICRIMKNYLTILLSIISISTFAAQDNDYRMWYDKPAARFEEALPLGNGRIGVTVYGGVEYETLHLNEETMWGGSPTDTNPTPEAPDFLPQVRDLLFKEQWGEARKLLVNIQGPNSNAYVPLGDLRIHQTIKGEVSSYERDLDLRTAVAGTSFTAGDVSYRREIFVSAPAQVAVMRVSASKPKSISLEINGTTSFEGSRMESVANDEFVVSGQLPRRVDSDRKYPIVWKDEQGRGGVRYQYRVKAIIKDGYVTTNPGLAISNASEVILLISAATSYNGYDKCPDTEGKDEAAIALGHLADASVRGYEEMKAEHIADYRHFFDRVALDLSYDGSKNSIPTDRRLAEYSKGATDLGLEQMYFQFGRYLMISASRPGGMAMNLQGIWNPWQRPSWGSNYTLNINLEMNYWPAEILGMSELTEPLIHQILNLYDTGQDIARNFYRMGGWAVHHNSDIWALANPVGWQEGDPKWANWSLGSPWLSQHLYEHYKFTMDRKFLSDIAYPLMKGAAEFCEDWLVEKDRWLITAPSTSPENVFIDEHGMKGVVTIGSAIDLEIIWDLFNNLVEVGPAAGASKEEVRHWADLRDRLQPLKIGRKGNLVEWYKDWEDDDPQHRHVSHMFALHPGRQISPIRTPELAAACRQTLEIRGDGGTGWSKAWKINFWARLLDGQRAYKLYRDLLSYSTLPNLFDTHPPFQIDGNFGSISGISEMLMQSHLDELHLLPAVPVEWSDGSISGICGRGGFVVDMSWKDSQLSSASILSKAGERCVLRTSVPVKLSGSGLRSHKSGGHYVLSFRTKAGQRYEIQAASK